MVQQASATNSRAGAPKGKPAPKKTASKKPPSARETEVFETAAEVFLEFGYAGATVQQVADQMGILKGSLYYYIRSKDDMLYRIISDLYKQMTPSLTLHEHDGDAVGQLREFVRLHLELVVANRAKFAVFYSDFRFLAGAQKKRVMHWRGQYEGVFTDLVRQAIIAGQIDPELDVALFARSWLGMLNSLYLWYRSDRGNSPAQLADTYLSWMLDGVRRDHRSSRVPSSGGSAKS